jgi:hypothetical protein
MWLVLFDIDGTLFVTDDALVGEASRGAYATSSGSSCRPTASPRSTIRAGRR